MRLKVISTILLVMFSFSQAFSWGQTGHRAIGEIASKYLNRKAQKKLNEVLNGESLAIASVWMDEVRSDRSYNYTADWHWVTIPDGTTYEQTEKNPNGDIIMTIERLIKELNEGALESKNEQEYVKMLIHLVGDIHQPCHVGNGEDKGGNDIKLQWFGKSSNLHRVWDSEMIDGKNLSYTELAKAVDIENKEKVEKWQNDPLNKWVQEAIALRSQVYDFPDDKNLRYEYAYQNWDTVQNQILKAGIRLAEVLNQIYG